MHSFVKKDSKTSYIYTVETRCIGCNKCISKCPTKANIAYWENSKNIVNIKPGYCISCGECISICDRKARVYYDDTELFFNALKDGKPLSLVIAPSAHVNFKQLPNLIGYLKSLGINKVYDVSYGADICTWAYVKHIKATNPKTLIAQPCPVVVSYVEKFHSELIDYLSPVQSPVHCLATYLKLYEKTEDDITFLSPCIGKTRECNDKKTKGVLKYNITFAKLQDYIEKNGINLNDYPAAEFDSVATSIGFAFPRPGGLTENIKLHLGDNIWTKQIEGIFKIEDYFKQYLKDIDENNPVPLIIDALNCEHGCNLGTGCRKDISYNYIDNSINERKNKVTITNTEELMKHFNEKLSITDFLRSYTDRSAEYSAPKEIDLEPIYIRLGKFTAEDRNINCFSCGYGSCQDFATAVASGDNHINNCHNFLLEKFTSLSTIDSLTKVFNRYSYTELLSSLQQSHPQLLGILFVDINKLKETNDLKGHDAGDELIKEAANILRKVFDENIYRIGGDEFVIITKCDCEQEFKDKVTNLKALLAIDEQVDLSLGFAFSKFFNELNDNISIAEKNMYADKADYYTKNKKYDRRG